MIGKPKYSYDDIVTFEIDGKLVKGYVYIIDIYGTFEDDSEVSYDIMDDVNKVLYKHIREDCLTKTN